MNYTIDLVQNGKVVARWTCPDVPRVGEFINWRNGTVDLPPGVYRVVEVTWDQYPNFAALCIVRA